VHSFKQQNTKPNNKQKYNKDRTTRDKYKQGADRKAASLQHNPISQITYESNQMDSNSIHRGDKVPLPFY
jgi:hypothetical protein